MDRQTQADEMRRLSAAPNVMLGSVHAVTETGAGRGVDEWSPITEVTRELGLTPTSRVPSVPARVQVLSSVGVLRARAGGLPDPPARDVGMTQTDNVAETNHPEQPGDAWVRSTFYGLATRTVVCPLCHHGHRPGG